MPALVILRSLKRPVPSPDLASLQVSTVSAAICPMSYGPAATVFRYVTPRGCPATITMSGRIASSRNVPERSGHCLTRMLPWPRHFGNRRPIGSSDWHPKDPAAWGTGPGPACPGGDSARPAFLFDRRAAFPSRPGAARAAARNGGDGRSGATRSHAQRALSREHGEDGEHRTFPEVSTVAHSAPVGGPGRRGSTWKRWKHFRRGNATAHPD